MNNLRVPIAILVVIIVVLAAWFILARPSSSVPVQQTIATSAATTTDLSQSVSTQPSAPLPDLDAVASNAPGVWQSTDDPNYVVDVTSNGKWTDEYKGSDASNSVSETGTYTLFTSANAPSDFTGTLVPGVVYVKLTEAGDTYFYSVLEANGTNLQLSYLARGNTLSFVKSQ